ncbi:MAG: ion channel [Chlamydiota bacterium]|nr:ion channel [Chlamydiota bacterium]
MIYIRKRIKALLYVGAVSLLITTVLFWFFEHLHNVQIHNYFDVLWWWVVTSATVGYGDIVPVTWQGRVVAIAAIITGFYIYTNFIAIIAESVHHYLERHSRGKKQVRVRDHIVICEYTAVADELIQALPKDPALGSKRIVVVSDLVTHNPYHQHLFVFGVPINPDVLGQANTAFATHIFIFANFRFADPDIKTLHIASRVRDMNPDAVIFAELVNPQSDLVKYISRNVVVMPSRQLVETVLRDKTFYIHPWLEQAKNNMS